jgi:aspartate racemase
MKQPADKAGGMIGIVGGVGPHAGIDLARKILDQTAAGADQDHLPMALLSLPGEITDRTEFLVGRAEGNPAEAIARVILDLERIGAGVVGIPCNTAHAPAIFEPIRRALQAAGSAVRLVHMIDEVARFLREHFPKVARVGVLCTTGTYRSRVYPDCLEPHGYRVLLPDEGLQEQAVQPAIYDPQYGIKARAEPVTDAARRRLDRAIDQLRRRGSEAVILGCSEIPLAVTEARIGETVILDANLVLARALIREADPEKLRPFAP